MTSVALLVVTGCSGPTVVDTGEWATFPTSAAPAAPELPPIDSAHLANAARFVAYENDLAAYYFATPSGRWQCAILPRDKAGCQATGGGALNIADAPDTVTDAEGQDVPPNAIVIEPGGDAHIRRAATPRVCAAGACERVAVQQNSDRGAFPVQHPGGHGHRLPQRGKRQGLHVQFRRVRSAVQRSTARHALVVGSRVRSAASEQNSSPSAGGRGVC